MPKHQWVINLLINFKKCFKNSSNTFKIIILICFFLSEFFAKFHNDFMGQLLMSDSLGVAQARASDHWIVTGDFALHSQ